MTKNRIPEIRYVPAECAQNHLTEALVADNMKYRLIPISVPHFSGVVVRIAIGIDSGDGENVQDI
jgi:hypothetical protein